MEDVINGNAFHSLCGIFILPGRDIACCRRKQVAIILDLIASLFSFLCDTTISIATGRSICRSSLFVTKDCKNIKNYSIYTTFRLFNMIYSFMVF